MRKKEITLPTIVGLLVAVFGLISGLWLLKDQVAVGTKAIAEETPVGVRVTNVSDTSFAVSWTTERAVSGFIQYGENQEPDLIASDERDQQRGVIENYFTHFVIVRGLKPKTRYYFRVGSGKNVYDRGGKLYEVETGPVLTDPPTADMAYGRVLTSSGDPAEGAIVYVGIPGISTQATLVKASGSWVVPLSTARAENLMGFADYDRQEDLVEINVIGGPMGNSRVLLTTANDNPAPNITLGQDYDYTRVDAAAPSAQPGIKNSKFTAGSLGAETGAELLKLLAPKFGEKVNNSRPQIIGEAPAGTEITVEIRSEPIIGKVVAGANGKFSYSVPKDLAPGEHTVTITAIINGVSRKITQSFTVYAQGESSLPFFTATPSATLTVSPSPTRRPTATIIPSPTPGLSPTPVPTTKPPTVSPTAFPTPSPTAALTPKPSPTTRPVVATDSGLPASGDEAPTLVLLAIGLGLVIAGAWWYRRTA